MFDQRHFFRAVRRLLRFPLPPKETLGGSARRMTALLRAPLAS
jgi:hypothetical protein